MKQGWKVHFAGRVQGVGFRFQTLETARDFAVAGTVQNLSDGRVRLIFEAEKSEGEAFLAMLRERMSDYISDVKIDVTDATGQFADFAILRSTGTP